MALTKTTKKETKETVLISGDLRATQKDGGRFCAQDKTLVCPCFGFFVFSALMGTMTVPEMCLRQQTKEQPPPSF